MLIDFEQTASVKFIYLCNLTENRTFVLTSIAINKWRYDSNVNRIGMWCFNFHQTFQNWILFMPIDIE